MGSDVIVVTSFLKNGHKRRVNDIIIEVLVMFYRGVSSRVGDVIKVK